MKKKFVGLAATFFVLGSAVAQANPNVKASITQTVVKHDANGQSVSEPLTASTLLRPGTVVEYTIVAMNAGTDAAHDLKPVAKIPSSTSYKVGSALSSVSGAKPEFSIDGGKTWSLMPTVRVHTSQGVVERAADASMYQAIRWSDPENLAANGHATFTYDVVVR